MQDGQTATNPQTGEKVVLRGGQWVPVGQASPAPMPQPSAPVPIIYGQPDPSAGLDMQLKQGQIQGQQQGLLDAEQQRELRRLQIEEAKRKAAEEQAKAAKFAESRTTAATSLARVLTQIDAIDQDARDNGGWFETGATGAMARSISGTAAYDLGQNIQTIDANSAFTALQAMRDASPTGGALGNITEKELELLKSQIANLNPNQSQESFLKNLKIAREYYQGILGRIDPQAEAQYRQRKGAAAPAAGGEQGDGPIPGAPPRPTANSDYALVREDQIPEAPARHFSPEQEAQVEKAIRDGDFGLAYKLIDQFNGPSTPDGGSIRRSIDALRKDPRQKFAMDYSAADKRYEEQLRQSNEAVDKARGRSGKGSDASSLFTQGSTSGLSDEISGATGFLGALVTGRNPAEAYTFDRDAMRLRNEEERKRSGAAGTVAEIGGALATPLPFGKAVQGARGVELAMQGAKTGAIAGGLAGFGYGEGYQSVPNALIGAGIGAPLGATVNVLAPRVGEGVKKLLAPSAKTVQRQAEMRAAGEAAQAAQAEGVPVSRAVLDPRSRNTVTALETTPGGNAPIREGLNATRQGIEKGVERLGQGGTARDAYEAGEMVQAAGHRSIKWARERANKLYETAKRLGGNTPVAPQQALSAVEQNIAELKGLPKANDALIKYMEDLKSDMSRGLNVDTLRSLRTQMRGQISERNLTASDAERRVIGILDAASDDIANSLSGNPAAAAAYKRADAFFKQKQQYIKDVVQRFIGRRDAPMSAEQSWQKFEGMARGQDSRRMAEMMRSLSPDEARDVAATFAESLGRNNAGDFTAAQLVSQTERLSDRAKLTIFGPEGARSLDNLYRVAKELKATQGNLNSSRTGVAQNYRSWLANLVGIGGGGAIGGATGGGTPAALVGAYAGKVLADKGDELIQGWSARALMSPEITRWLAAAPRTTNPAVIDSHVRRLAGIAANNPALAQEITVIQQRMVEAVRALPERAAASRPNARDDERNRRKEVPQR